MKKIWLNHICVCSGGLTCCCLAGTGGYPVIVYWSLKNCPLKIIFQVGPILGLVGTLIPLSPGLLGLMAGDMEILAQSLIIAFSTTVVGLAIAGVALVITLVRRRWYSQDISDIEYISATLLSK